MPNRRLRVVQPDRGFIKELIAQDPDITLHELRGALAEAEGVEVYHSPIVKLLIRLGFYNICRPHSSLDGKTPD